MYKHGGGGGGPRLGISIVREWMVSVGEAFSHTGRKTRPKDTWVCVTGDTMILFNGEKKQETSDRRVQD